MILKNKKLHFDYSQLLIVIKDCLDSNSKGYICAVNVNVLINCYKDDKYNEIVDSSLVNICDGVNVKRLNNILGLKKIQNYPAPDFFLRFIGEQQYKSFFLGGTSEISLSLFKYLKKKYKNIKDEDFYSPPFLGVDDFDYQEIAGIVNKSCPDVIWIGLGAPKQEVFMNKLLPFIERGVMIGVGAVFNFYSGNESLKRAPYVFRKYNLEWLYRALQEPKRIIPRQIKSAYYLPQILISGFMERYR